MIAAAVSGLLAGYGIAVPVGAIVLLISISATTCLCIGVSAGLGAATIDGDYALPKTASGISTLSVRLPLRYPKCLGCRYRGWRSG